MNANYLVVMTTVASEADATRLAESIVEGKLAACVQMQNISSVYRWDGKLCREPEILLAIKTSTARYAELENHIKASHPYQTPEIAAVPLTHGSREYLRWIDNSIAP